jgi:hypothetical protein
VLVMMDLDPVSRTKVNIPRWRGARQFLPSFSDPQQSHTSTLFLIPLEAGSKFPHCIQKTREPIAAIVVVTIALFCSFLPLVESDARKQSLFLFFSARKIEWYAV